MSCLDDGQVSPSASQKALLDDDRYTNGQEEQGFMLKDDEGEEEEVDDEEDEDFDEEGAEGEDGDEENGVPGKLDALKRCPDALGSHADQ